VLKGFTSDMALQGKGLLIQELSPMVVMCGARQCGVNINGSVTGRGMGLVFDLRSSSAIVVGSHSR
jgi:hypothetical protein